MATTNLGLTTFSSGTSISASTMNNNLNKIDAKFAKGGGGAKVTLLSSNSVNWEWYTSSYSYWWHYGNSGSTSWRYLTNYLSPSSPGSLPQLLIWYWYSMSKSTSFSHQIILTTGNPNSSPQISGEYGLAGTSTTSGVIVGSLGRIESSYVDYYTGRYDSSQNTAMRLSTGTSIGGFLIYSYDWPTYTNCSMTLYCKTYGVYFF